MEDTTQTANDPINAPHVDPPAGHGADPVDKTKKPTNEQKANAIRIRIGEVVGEIATLTAERDSLNAELLQVELSTDNA